MGNYSLTTMRLGKLNSSTKSDLLWPCIVAPVGLVDEGEGLPLLLSSRKMVSVIQQPRESKMVHLHTGERSQNFRTWDSLQVQIE